MKLTVPNSMELARKYLLKRPPAVSGQGGHTATFRVALALAHGHGLTEEQALEAMRDWNRTCQPPWSEAELRYKITSAIH